MFCEVTVLHIDGIAFSIVTDGIMNGFGVYVMVVSIGIFVTSNRWVFTTIAVVVSTWFLALWYKDFGFSPAREAMMIVSSISCGIFFYVMRIRAAQRLGEHQLMEQKYKEGLESALVHIDNLTGLLPICASCKDIRDEDGSWSAVETYVTEHSEEIGRAHV